MAQCQTCQTLVEDLLKLLQHFLHNSRLDFDNQAPGQAGLNNHHHHDALIGDGNKVDSLEHPGIKTRTDCHTQLVSDIPQHATGLTKNLVDTAPFFEDGFADLVLLGSSKSIRLKEVVNIHPVPYIGRYSSGRGVWLLHQPQFFKVLKSVANGCR